MPKSLSQLFGSQTPDVSSARSSSAAPLDISPRAPALGGGALSGLLLMSPETAAAHIADPRSGGTTFSSWLRDANGELRDPFLVFARPIVFHIIGYLSDSDLYALSICSKRLLQYSLADSVVWERRQQRQFPFNLAALWKNLIAKRYPAMRMAEAMLSWPEKNAVIRKVGRPARR